MAYTSSFKGTFFNLKDSLIEQENKNVGFCFSHGDLCFNNILADPLSGIIKVIDPRVGSDSELPLGALPRLYDLAKINHSVTYLYDSIVNNLFEINCDSPANFALKIYTPRRYQMIRSVFVDIFGDDICSPAVNLTTASLFLSMLPLHADSPTKMLAFSIMGSTILNHPFDSGLHPTFR